MSTYLFLDTETTGLDVERHGVWEIAYAIDDGPIKQSFVRGHDITTADPKALEINRYYDRFPYDSFSYDWSAAEEFEEELKRSAEGLFLVGSNPAFDNRFLVKRWGERPWNYRMIDLAAYAMPYFGWVVPEGMANIAKALDIEEHDHSAAKDVEVLRKCFYALQQKYNLERAFA